MNRFLAVLALLLAHNGLAAGDVGHSAALVLSGPPAAGVDGLRIASLRNKLAEKYRLLDDEKKRALLEGTASQRSRADSVRDRLSKAAAKLRSFDMPQVRFALAEAQIEAAKLPPSAEGRKLVAEVALRQAALAIVEHDERLADRCMQFALSADPTLTLDSAREPPPLIALQEHIRAQRAARPSAQLRVISEPAGSEIAVENATGNAPLTLRAAVGPVVVWATHADREATNVRFEVRDGANELAISLPIQDANAALEPLLATLRQVTASERAEAANRLAIALRVDLVVLASPDLTQLEIYRLPRFAAKPQPKPKVVAALAGLTGASALALIVTGSVALAEKDRYQASCSTVCNDSVYRSGRSLAISTDVLIGVSAALAITTVVLAVVLPKKVRRVALTPAGVAGAF